MEGRRVATIMFTDLVGSTRMRGELGDHEADRIAQEHDRIILDSLAANDGRLVKNLGDGVLATFESPVDSVRSGVQIQEGVAAYNGDADRRHQISVRIGINAGEVALTHGDLSGLPVAIASRVCDKAEGGQILLTEVVKTLIGRRSRFPFTTIGSHLLKGVTEPHELWLLADLDESESGTMGVAVPFPPFLERGLRESLVGREEAFNALSRYLQEAKTHPYFVTVVGEPGIGKTSLTATWAKTVANEGSMVVGGRCSPDHNLPYEPFLEVAGTIVRANPHRLSEAGPAAGNLAQLLPLKLPQAGLPVPITTDPETTTYLMGEAFARLMAPLEGAPPTVIVIDDIHWADEQTVAVIGHLSRKAEELPLLIVGSYRDTDLVRDHPLPGLLADLRRNRLTSRVDLDRLSTDEISEMITARFVVPVDPEVIASIAFETRGNPFFVEEITRHLIEQGAIDRSGAWAADVPISDYSIPEGIREVVGRRLGMLGDDSLALLEAAAVVGPSFTFEVVSQVADLDTAPADNAIDRALESGLILEGDGVDDFGFAHALVRQTLYEGLTARRRLRIQARVAEALDEAGVHPRVLVAHWLEAGRSNEALKAALEAADQVKAFAVDEMVQHLSLAADLWEDVEDPEGSTGITHPELILRLTRAQWEAGLSSVGSVDLLAKELATEEMVPETRALLLAQYATWLTMHGRSIEAFAAHQEGMSLLTSQMQDQTRGEVLLAYGGDLFLANRYDEASDAVDQVLSLDLDPRGSLGERVLPIQGEIARSRGDVGTFRDAYKELGELAELNGNMRGILLPYVNVAEGLSDFGLRDEALEISEKGVAIAREFGADRWVAMIEANIASLHYHGGDLNAATASYENQRPHPVLDIPEFNRIGYRLALAAELGDVDIFAEEEDRLRHWDPFEDIPQHSAPVWAARVARLRWNGEIEEAFLLAERALETLTDPFTWGFTIDLAAFGIETVGDAADRGTVDNSWLEAADGWMSMFDREDNAPANRSTELITHARAEMARAVGSNDPEKWRNAVEAWDGNPYWQAKALWRLAQALLEADLNYAEARRLLDDAEEIANLHRARPLLDAIKKTRPQPT